MSRSRSNSATMAPPVQPMLDDSGRGVMRMKDVARFLGCSDSTARRLCYELMANWGLKKKGRGIGTHFDRANFMAAYQAMDTRN